MIKNIIFDMGNVLIQFDRDLFIQRTGVSREDMDVLMSEIFLSLEWSMLDSGALLEDEAIERMCKRIPSRLWDKVDQLVNHWDSPVIPIPKMADLCRELKENGYGIYLLSNASCRQHEYWGNIPGSEYFDGTVISADVKLVKPQPEIYLYTLNYFGLKNDECIFIDDVIENVDGAMSCGIHSILFSGNINQLQLELKKMGVIFSHVD